MTLRLVIADDHMIFRQGLTTLLNGEPHLEIIGVADNGANALEMIRTERPDVAILDITMPEPGAIEIAKIITSESLVTKVIALTMHKNTTFIHDAIAVGVVGYVLKDNAFEDLVSAINSVSAGGTFISPSVAIVAVDSPGSGVGKLTNRERQVLVSIANGNSNRQIAAELFISIKTVETHRARLMRKLDLHKTAELVRYALENGLN
jgi:DNA-binding NarL/FixJ family response regulator